MEWCPPPEKEVLYTVGVMKVRNHWCGEIWAAACNHKITFMQIQWL